MIFAKPWEYLWGSWHWHYSFRRARGRRLTSGEAHVRNLDGLPRLKEGNCHGTSLQFLRIIVYCIVLYYCNLGEFKCLFLQNFPFEVELGQQVDCIHNIKPFSSVWGGRKFFRHGWVASWDCLTTYTLLRHHKNISFKQFVSILLLNFGGCGLRYVLRRLRVAMPSEFLPQLGHVVGFQLEYLTHLCKDEWSVFIPLLNFRVMVIREHMQRTFLKISFLLGIGTKILIDTWAASLYIHKYTAAFVASSLHDPWSLMSIRFTLTCHHTS